MIQKLDNKLLEISVKIREVFQSSYAVEAALLNAKIFPPLERKLEEYINCENEFYGYWKKDDLAAVVEIRDGKDFIHIQSLVVEPKYFRNGMASAMISFVVENYDTDLFMVETGAANKPAIFLYEKHGFVLVEEFDATHGIRKVRFEKVT